MRFNMRRIRRKSAHCIYVMGIRQSLEVSGLGNRQVNELLNRQPLKAQRGFGSMNCRNISRINVDSATASCSSFSVKGSAATLSTGLGVLG